MDSMLLSLKNISKSYPGVRAMKEVSLDIRRGDVHALVGENGAGKSTLIKVIAGAIQPDSGVFTFNGQDYTGMTPALAAQLGIQVIYQEFNLIPNLSVAENIFMGEKFIKRGIIDRKILRQKALSVLDRINLRINPNIEISELSMAYMQMVEIAKAISRDVKFLIMDEPTAPLTNDEVDTLFSLIRELKNQGITIIYITHRLQELFEISNRLTVMRDGAIIKTMETRDAAREELVKLMVGREATAEFSARAVVPGTKPVLEVRNVRGNGVKGASFAVMKGEILGIAGLIGAGRTELARLIFGADQKEGGEILLEGRKTEIKNPAQAVQLGIGLVPEDRKQHGAILSFPIQWNITLAVLKKLCKGILRSNSGEENCAGNQRKMLNIKTPNLMQEVNNLSGGNQQKVVLAKWLATQCRVLILDEPTRGIDVGAKLEIYNIMNDLSVKGIGIIMISSEMDELLGMADRIVVLCEGEQTGFLERDDFSREKVLFLASGNK